MSDTGEHIDQPCATCGETITWRGRLGGWVHAASGKAWEPYDMEEWQSRVRILDGVDKPQPHRATPQSGDPNAPRRLTR